MSPREVVHNESGEVSRGLGVTGEAIHPSEVLSRHGVGGNAEVLTQAVREHNPKQLRAALAKRPDAERTKALKAGTLEYPDGSKSDGIVDVDEIAGEGATVIDKAVRGTGSVTYAAVDGQGTIYKGTFELDDPEGTHISQAEVLGQEGSVAQPIVGARRQAAAAAQQGLDERRQTLDAREQALNRREKELAEAERAAGSGDGDGGQDGDGQGGGEPPPAEGQGAEGGSPPERPDVLPANFDELNADDAAKVVAGLEGDARARAIAYEQETKQRQTVLRLAEGGGS